MLVLCAVGALEEPPISPPVPVEAAAPLMPGDAPVLEHPATVLLRLTIDDVGAVSRVEVRESAGPVFDRAAMGAAVRWRFEPARRGGVPLEVQVDVPVQFTPARAGEALAEGAAAAPSGAESERAATGDTSHGEEGAVLSATVSTEPVDGPTGESSPLDVPEASKSSAGGFSTTVRGEAEAPPPVAVGDFHIEVGQLADVPRNSASDLMLLAPGVMLANHGGEGHAETVFIRGFDAGEGKDVEMRLNGVPLNEVSHAHGHGYADTYFIIPELVDSLRVTEGPYDASQGDFGVAGTVEYQLGLARRGLTASASYGSFASRRLALVWGPPESTEATFVGLLLRQGQGFGPNRSFANATALAQVELRLGDDTRLRLLGASHGARFASAGVVRETDVVDARLPCAADADSQFFCFYDENQGGASQRHLVSAELQSRLKRGGRMVQQGYVVLRQTRIRDNFTGFIQDTPPGEDAQRGDGTEGYYRGSTLGLRGRYIPGLTLLGQSRPLELGYVARYDDVRTRSRRLRDSGGAPYSTLF